MRIETDNNGWQWTAIDADTYDGAPDAPPQCRRYGRGATKAEAIADLLEQIEDDA